MPIANWYCRSCKADVPLDHFEHTACGETVCHPDYATSILSHQQLQKRGDVRVTHGLGCPRRAVIEATEEYTVDPLAQIAPATGTAWHEAMERDDTASEVEVHGILAGINVRGTIDRLRNDLIEDWKCVADDSLRYIADTPKLEHVVQVSIYAELAEQSGLKRPERGIIWYKTFKALRPVPCDLLPIDTALEVKPYGGEYSVAELYGQACAGLVSRIWSNMPLAGSTQSFGKTSACNYCAVRSICTEAVSGAPF